MVHSSNSPVEGKRMHVSHGTSLRHDLVGMASFMKPVPPTRETGHRRRAMPRGHWLLQDAKARIECLADTASSSARPCNPHGNDDRSPRSCEFSPSS
jgi:hypothetical protein